MRSATRPRSRCRHAARRPSSSGSAQREGPPGRGYRRREHRGRAVFRARHRGPACGAVRRGARAFVARQPRSTRRRRRSDSAGGLGLVGPDGRAYFELRTRDRRAAAEGRRRLDDETRRFRPVRQPAPPSGFVCRTTTASSWLQRLRPAARPLRHVPAAMPATASPPIVRRVTVNRIGVALRRRTRPSSTRPRSTRQPTRFGSSSPRRTSSTRAATEYQSRLDGLDPDWSAWTQRSAARLHQPRIRRLHVPRPRARLQPAQVSEEAVYAFTILPPWYRTWWAYAGYLLLAGLLARVGSTACSAGAWSARNASARSSPKRSCAPKPPRRWRAPRARARRTSSC